MLVEDSQTQGQNGWRTLHEVRMSCGVEASHIELHTIVRPFLPICGVEQYWWHGEEVTLMSLSQRSGHHVTPTSRVNDKTVCNLKKSWSAIINASCRVNDSILATFVSRIILLKIGIGFE